MKKKTISNKLTKAFVSGKIAAIRSLIEGLRLKYPFHYSFDKNLDEAIYAINRAENAMEAKDEK